jgi:hypothetical protein
MIAAIHQPLYQPWQGYFSKLVRSDVFVFFDDVQFPRSRSLFNRNAIKSATGPLWLTVPVKGKGDLLAVKDVEVDSTQNWQQKHWRAICLNYSKAPHFAAYKPAFERVYTERPWERFSDLCRAVIEAIASALELQTRFVLSSELGLPAAEGAQRLVNIVKAVGADRYLTGGGAGSQRHMDADLFERHGITVDIHAYAQEPYPQLWGPYLPDLAMIDLLFNCGGARSKERLLDGSKNAS